ncbi:hypothetical protein [Methylocapsa aurea]|uniref:hypothetical protein n=1 Tax=Methylocapsa aurea TaxID=663610 RepID=UPI003D18B6E2
MLSLDSAADNIESIAVAIACVCIALLIAIVIDMRRRLDRSVKDASSPSRYTLRHASLVRQLGLSRMGVWLLLFFVGGYWWKAIMIPH